MDYSMDLWGELDNELNSAEEALTLIKEQANLLTQKTNGEVKAIFEKIDYTMKYSGMYSLLSSFPKMSTTRKEEIETNPELENAKVLYKAADYRFEFINDTYKYRLFVLKYSPLYPIKIEVEAGILDQESKIITIDNLDELKDQLIDIFKSKKVKFILGKMREMKTKKEDK